MAPRTRLARRFVDVALGAPIIWACTGACSSGSGSGGVPGGGGSIPLEDFPAAYASALCDNIGPCCTQAGRTYDASSCKALVGALAASVVGSVNSGKVKYDASAAGQCLELAKSSAGSCNFDFESAACDQVFTGTVPEGGACDEDLECIGPPGAHIDCDNEVCVVEKRGAAGDPCTWTCTENGAVTSCSGSGSAETGARCFTNDSLYCDSDEQVCKPQLAVGATGCGFDDDACASGAYCDSDTCTAKVEVGGSCSGSGTCVETAYCEQDTCMAKKPLGAACTSSSECLDGNCDADKCVGDAGGFAFFCGQ